jgi:hypothetical protein
MELERRVRESVSCVTKQLISSFAPTRHIIFRSKDMKLKNMKPSKKEYKKFITMTKRADTMAKEL